MKTQFILENQNIVHCTQIYSTITFLLAGAITDSCVDLWVSTCQLLLLVDDKLHEHRKST